MKNYILISEVIHHVKEISEGLSPAEKEQLRDELLAFFLFSEFNNNRSSREIDRNVSMNSLSEEERDLIKKLADQTEALFKAKGNTGKF
jgi:hypothetical protein